MTDKPKTVEDIAPILGEIYYIRKDAEDEQKILRTDFFLAAAIENASKKLARKTVVTPASVQTSEEASAYAELYYTGWKIVENDDVRKVIIEEDPDFLPYSIVVPIDGGVIDAKGKEHPGYVITKSIVSGSAMLDIDRLQIEDPELYEQVTYVPLIEQAIAVYGEGNRYVEDLQALVADLNLPRLPKNPDLLTDEQAARIKQYSYESPKTKKLLVRFAKEDELGEG
jgi:hypothetical protein